MIFASTWKLTIISIILHLCHQSATECKAGNKMITCQESQCSLFWTILSVLNQSDHPYLLNWNIYNKKSQMKEINIQDNTYLQKFVIKQVHNGQIITVKRLESWCVKCQPFICHLYKKLKFQRLALYSFNRVIKWHMYDWMKFKKS